ncbi:6626_t:CDS:2, partial [Ambispora gerdemannii]
MTEAFQGRPVLSFFVLYSCFLEGLKLISIAHLCYLKKYPFVQEFNRSRRREVKSSPAMDGAPFPDIQTAIQRAVTA